MWRLVNDQKESFQQTYVLSVKIEFDPSIFLYPVMYALMKRRNKATYQTMLERMIKIHETVSNVPILPFGISLDMESAPQWAFKTIFGQDLPVVLCAFHLKQAARKRLKIIFPGNQFRAARLAIGEITNAMVFSPFVSNPDLITELYELWRKTGRGKSVEIKNKIEKWTDWWDDNYMSTNNHKRYENWNYFDLVCSGVNDCTNNTSETLNRKFNNTIRHGFKSFSEVADSFFTNKSQFLEEYDERVPNKKLRLRPPALRLRMEARRKILLAYREKTKEDQVKTYASFINDVRKQL